MVVTHPHPPGSQAAAGGGQTSHGALGAETGCASYGVTAKGLRILRFGSARGETGKNSWWRWVLERHEDALLLWNLWGRVSRKRGVRQPGTLRNIEQPRAGERSGCRWAAVRGGSRLMGEGLDQDWLECRAKESVSYRPWKAMGSLVNKGTMSSELHLSIFSSKL